MNSSYELTYTERVEKTLWEYYYVSSGNMKSLAWKAADLLENLNYSLREDLKGIDFSWRNEPDYKQYKENLKDLLKARLLLKKIIRSAPAILLFLSISAQAAPPSGTDLTSPEHAWFEKQWSIGDKNHARSWCCDVSDGHFLDDSQWRTVGLHYEVSIAGKWYEIMPWQYRDPKGGPNPTGQAIVWYSIGYYGVQIFCFTPGTEG